MSYSNQMYDARAMVMVAEAASFGTATGAGTASNALSSVIRLPKLLRRTKISKIRVRCTTAPNAAATAVVASFKNGTSTFGAVTLTTAAANDELDATITAANTTFAADGQPTVDVNGTFTASGGTVGAYSVFFEQQELFA